MVEVRRKPRETTPALIRRFSLKVRVSGILKEAKKRRFHTSPLNKEKRKKKALRKIEKKKEISLLE